MNFKKNYKGMLLCLIIAIPCWFLGKKFPIVGGPVFGIILGMIITLLLLIFAVDWRYFRDWVVIFLFKTSFILFIKSISSAVLKK